MKEFWKSWKFWVAVAAVILAIICVVLYFTKPIFCYFASGLLIGLLGGYIIGFFIAKKQYYIPAKK